MRRLPRPVAARAPLLQVTLLRVTLLLAPMLLVAIGDARAAPPPPQRIGSWLLDCTDQARTGGCILRDRAWLLPPAVGRPAAALEVQRLGEHLVPVVTLRGVSTQAALGGLLALRPRATLTLQPGPSAALTCALDAGAVICAPQGDDVAALAGALPVASAVDVQMQLSLAGMALPPEGGSLTLHDTAAALARLRLVGAMGEALPAIPGLDWVGFLDRVMRAAGFENDAVGLVTHLAGR